MAWIMILAVRNIAQPESRRNAHEERNQLFSWMTEMLEGSELDEPRRSPRW